MEKEVKPENLPGIEGGFARTPVYTIGALLIAGLVVLYGVSHLMRDFNPTAGVIVVGAVCVGVGIGLVWKHFRDN